VRNTINKQSNRGFTIIELLVVIIVIGVLTILTMVIYTGIQAKVFDLSVSTDIDRLNALELKYKTEHGTSGKAFYSGDGVDAEINFTPKNGNIFDVVTDATDYCIRGYNLHGTKDSIYNAYTKESNPGACNRIPPSTNAAATPSTPLAPVVAVTMNSNEIIAAITPVTCAVGAPQYAIKSRVDDGVWTSFSEWSGTIEVSRQAEEGVKYGYLAEARCYISYTSSGSDAVIGIEASYSNLYPPSGPSVTVTQNAGNIVATITPVTCITGPIQYATHSQINGGAWTGYTAWSSSTTASQAATGGEGVKYTYQVQSRCYISDTALSPTSTGTEGSYTSPITAPAAPSVSSTTTPGYTTTYTWGAASCAAGTTARYQYKLTMSPSGYDSGWAATAGLSAAFTTSTGDQTYTVQVQGQCYTANTSSSWSASGSTSYYCVYDPLPIATSISGYWLTAPSDYMLEDGSAISRTTYADLYAIIGTTYGVGDGSTTFNLPDSRGRTTVNKSPTDTEFDVIGEKYGEKAHILTGAESGLIGHNHLQDAHLHSTGVNIKNAVGWVSLDSAYFGTGGNYGMQSTASTTATNIAAPAANASSAHNTIQPSIVKVFAIKYRPATASSSMLSVASSVSGYWSTTPSGYLIEDGSAVSRTTYSDLFAAISTTYGVGDGSTTFNLPDSRGRATVNKSPTDTEFDVMGEKYGEKFHTDTIAESGERGHNHTQNAHSHTNNINIKNTVGWIGLDSAYFGTGGNYGMGNGGSTTATNQAVASSDASSAHNTIQPSIVKLSVIKYTAAAGSIDNTAKGTSVQGYWATAPSGYLLEDGTAVSRVTYSSLYTVIGTTYGVGDGSTTFNLPDSRGRTAVNKNPSDAEFATIGQKYGEKVHLLLGAESGEKGHNHIQDAHLHTTGINIKNTVGWISLDSAYFGTGGNYGSGTTGSTTATNQAVAASNAVSAHNNIQPSIVQNFAIRY